jgi:hypothetical protein
MAKPKRRVYEEIRTMVEKHGGTMNHYRKGYPSGGAWVIRYGGKEKVFMPGGRKYPSLDNLLVPKVPNPQTWDDFYNQLREDAWEKLLKLLNDDSSF